MKTGKTRAVRWIAMAACIAGGLLFLLSGGAAHASDAEVSTLRPERQTGLANGGWWIDRYKDASRLDAGKSMVVADLKGPGVINQIHMTRMNPEELASRGIVLEIWFDDAKEPAVMCPVADFFGDGCNGNSTNFSSSLIDCAPWSYNCFFRMPFAKSAKVILRNDTTRDINNYTFVEWETLPKWDPSQGYFHATYRRDVFQLTKTTDHTFFEIKGSGHVIGRQLSMVSDERLFGGHFGYAMEGNNEVDIDGQERRLDYLGTEDSFNFSWGYQEQFAGFRFGAPLVEKNVEGISRVSVYRFHEQSPIRFSKSLRWHINWGMERMFNNLNNEDPRPGAIGKAAKRAKNWEEALARDGCWLDYAFVFYWYQDQPGGFTHQPLPPVEERMKPLLRSSNILPKLQ